MGRVAAATGMDICVALFRNKRVCGQRNVPAKCKRGKVKLHEMLNQNWKKIVQMSSDSWLPNKPCSPATIIED